MLPILALDSETELIEPGTLAPRLVCVSATADGTEAELIHWRDAGPVLHEALDRAGDGRLLIKGQNIAYDMAVFAAFDESLLPKIFAAYDRGGIRCSMLDEMLIDLAYGRLKWHDDEEGEPRKIGYSLEDIVTRRGLLRGRDKLDKGADGWRLRYKELRDTPIADWPERAKTYPQDDALDVYWIHKAQLADAEALARAGYDDVLYDSPAQARQAFGLHLMSAWGIHTDPEAIGKLEEALTVRLNDARKIVTAAGLFQAKGKKVVTVSKNMASIRARVLAALGPAAPMTGGGKKGIPQIKTDAMTLEATGDPDLAALVEFSTVEKLLGTYVQKLWAGVETPIQPRVNSLLETGRTSMSKPNLQNPPRAAGIRECYIPRKGFVFCSVDFDGAELRTLAQACLYVTGRSKLAELFQADPKNDIHVYFASDMLGISPEEGKRLKKLKDPHLLDTRQKAKAGLFGFPGGMGVDRFIATQAASDPPMVFTEDEARGLKFRWQQFLPEMVDYFAHVTNVVGYSTGSFRTFISKRWRGGCGFCDGANNYFQAAVADGAKDAVYEVAKRMYIVRSSALYGSRNVNFLHDEILAELPTDTAHEAAHEMADVMCTALRRHTPDVPITASPALMQRWYKKADPVYNEQGRLVPWQPEVKK